MSRQNITAQRRLKLLDLIDPAITVLAREMVGADKSADRQRAANSILDRAGLSRTVSSPDAEASAELLKEKLEQLRESRQATGANSPATTDPLAHSQQLIDRARAFYVDSDNIPEEEMVVRTRDISPEDVVAKVASVRPQVREVNMEVLKEAATHPITPATLLGVSPRHDHQRLGEVLQGKEGMTLAQALEDGFDLSQEIDLD